MNDTSHIDLDATYILWWGSSAYTTSGDMRESLKRILEAAAVKYVCVEECDCSEELRYRGDEYTFEMCARKNIDSIIKSGHKHLITPCPHSYNVISRYYTAMGLDVEVWHHSDFIATLIERGLLTIKKQLPATRMTYHDPCRLSRIGKTDAVRDIIKHISRHMIEAPHHSRESICCGGGAFLDTSSIPVKISIMRYEELLSTACDVIVTACPVCHDMLLSARTGDKTQVKDIACIVGECI